MVYRPGQVKKIIQNFIHSLKNEIRVDGVILFGSYAWGKPRSYSDIDVAIVSRDFLTKNEIKDRQFLFKKAAEVNSVIEPHPFHPAELKKSDKRTLLYQIMAHGKKIKIS